MSRGYRQAPEEYQCTGTHRLRLTVSLSGTYTPQHFHVTYHLDRLRCCLQHRPGLEDCQLRAPLEIGRGRKLTALE